MQFRTGTPEAVLWEFLSYPLNTSDDILKRFSELPQAVYKRGDSHRQAFVYIPGTRADAATLIAHADTVFDFAGEHEMLYEDGIIRSAQEGVGIGADDRAGCALLWLFKDSGHNILVIGGEEFGQPTAHYLVKSQPDILQEIQNSSFMLELDRRTKEAYRCYNIPVTQEFRDYIEAETGYNEREKGGITDICILCTEGCCGVNVSVSYYNAHSTDEYIRKRMAQ
jgi:hypothetical protein